ncbi:MAG: hypothetical protein AB8F78_12595 [Saprospiraceae bacterium]
MKFSLVSLCIAGLFSLVSCADTSVNTQAAIGIPSSASAPVERPEGWDAYWYSGTAEVNTYDLIQNRYGEDRIGDAVLVFVTEPFLPIQQVKDDGRPSKEEAVSVLKLNRIHRFNTGIYDYSLMLSAFTPVSRDQYPRTLKTSLSAQDWCGHSWWQLNLKKGKYQAERRSYFQSEADVTNTIDGVLLEDEIPALVRLDPTRIPTGKQQVIPGAMYSALFHKIPEAQNAEIRKVMQGNGEMHVSINYPAASRSLTYEFEGAFPNKLLGWKETVRGEVLSSATLKHSSQRPYWGQNSEKYAPLRDTLGL